MLVNQLQWEYDNRFAAKQEFLWALKYDPAQPRDDHGRWKSGWGDLLSAIRVPDGGFTYHPFTKTSPKSGFMVSIYKPHEQILDVGEVNGVTLARYVRKNRTLLRYHRNYLGVWHNPENGKVYLDVSRHTRSAKEARRLGKKHDQEAFFNLNTGKSVDLKPNGKETLAKIDQGSDRGGSRPVDEGPHREGTDTEGNRGDEENPLRRYAEVLKLQSIAKYDPAQPRDAEGQWSKIAEAAPKDFDKAEYDRLQKAHDTYVAIEQYVRGNAAYMNGTLRGEGQRARGQTPTGGYEKFEPNWEQVEAFDDHMAKNPLTEDRTLTRTVPFLVTKGLEVGDIFQDDGFVSTTSTPEAIGQIQKDIGHYHTAYQDTLTVLVPKGTGHIDVNKELGPDHRYAHQNEMILQRGLRFQVVSRSEWPGHEMVVKVVK